MNWYDYPEYYDIAFGWDTAGEIEFLTRMFRDYARIPVQIIYEPFCGTGRLAILLAKHGFRVLGVDLNSRAIDFARARCAASGVTVDLTVGDVCGWTPASPVDAIVTLIDSFRHLASAAAAARGIAAFRRSLRPGGLLIVGLCLGEAGVDAHDEAAWTMERDGIRVETCVKQLGAPGPDPGSWLLRHAMRVTERDGRCLEIATDDAMRVWTLEALLAAMREHGEFMPAALFDWSDLTRSIDLPGAHISPTGNHVVVFSTG